ncbi:hypothetical protein RY831_05095 [Noviherbaspirillum sp. CPCC 100848]|uniref:Uncharacterized protein n=1 Tax=Noviherbaspirillum album TaxID=3080276 RepID=A0ABU6J5B5_9BURK|nr:hypothetical protein [Noviherbaspirillum sp. CPCC 100848]MEC4718512.1 hypothetical protein [Noviherbaspirillum sp. CPCC 100848]
MGTPSVNNKSGSNYTPPPEGEKGGCSKKAGGEKGGEKGMPDPEQMKNMPPDLLQQFMELLNQIQSSQNQNVPI